MRMSVVYTHEKRLFPWVACVMVAVGVLLLWMGIKIKPLVISVAKGYGENVVVNVLNEMIGEEIKKLNFEFTQVTYTSEGRVTSVKMDSGRVNTFMTDIALTLKDRIVAMEEIEAGIPLGNFLSNPFFSGMGPKIPVRFLILTNTNLSLEEKFMSKGINQTLYIINLKVETKIGIYFPGMRGSMTVESIVPVSQHLIVGEVPDNYTNVEGMEGSVQDTVLDIE